LDIVSDFSDIFKKSWIDLTGNAYLLNHGIMIAKTVTFGNKLFFYDFSLTSPHIIYNQWENKLHSLFDLFFTK
jgi:hypothetical protein